MSADRSLQQLGVWHAMSLRSDRVLAGEGRDSGRSRRNESGFEDKALAMLGWPSKPRFDAQRGAQVAKAATGHNGLCTATP